MKLPFKPRAQILLQLGEQLIKNENIAILELVKNSYDADATRAVVRMMDIDDPKNGYIEIIDNGSGMDIDIIKNVWMEPGNTHKRELVQNNHRSNLGRLPIGEKGIGRFGVHKLGKQIEIVTKTATGKEVVLKIDWNSFDNAQYLSDVPIVVEERNPQYFKEDESGTYIKIEQLSVGWTRGMLRKLYRALTTMNSPFESDKSFRIKLLTNKETWLDGLLRFNDIKEYALYEGEIILKANEMTFFKYRFKPYNLMPSLKERTVTREEPLVMRKQVKKNRKNEFEDIDLSKYNIGEIKIQLYAFDRDSAVLNQYIPDKASFKEYLDENGGVYVLRDGIRVMDYGEPDNDWLGLDIKRVNVPTKSLSNNIVLGAVYLDRYKSSSLKEKANREGFIEDSAYDCFRDAVVFALGQFTMYRNIDKSNMRLALSGGVKEPVKETISQIRDIVSKSNMEQGVRSQLDEALKKVEEELEFFKQRYMRAANAGLSYGIVIHEIEKIIGELKIAVKDSGTSEKIKNLSIHLSKLIDSYSELLRNRAKADNDLKQIIEQALFSVEYRIDAHEIEVSNYSAHYDGKAVVKSAANMLVGALINLIDNSIYWTTYAKVPKRKLYINITNEIDGYIGIVVADNGMGYQISGEDAIKPFVSTKEDGLGLGLNIVNEIMISQGGKIVFPEIGDITLPDDFKNGAVTILAFKKEN